MIFLILATYISSILFVCQSTSILSLWFSLELNSMMFLFLVKSLMESKIYPEFWVKYFLTQGSFSFLLIFSLSSEMLFLFLVILMAKLGVPPFHFWVLDFFKKIPIMIGIFLLTLQKIPIFYLSFSSESWFIILSWALSMTAFIIFSILVEDNLIMFLFFSSMVFSFEMLMMGSLVSWGMTIWFGLYTLLLLSFLWNSTKPNLLESSQTNVPIFIFFGAIPPMNLFFVKIFFMSNFANIFLPFFVYLGTSFFFFFFYARVSFLNFLKKQLSCFSLMPWSKVIPLFFMVWVWNIFL